MKEIISQKEALEKGLDFYSTGILCKRGHISDRRIENGDCVDCARVRANQWFLNNQVRRSVSAKNIYLKKSKEIRLSVSKYKKENTDKVNALKAKRYAAKLHRTPSWSDLDLIKPFYFEAQHLTKETGIKYDVDHIIPLQGEYVSGLHIASNLQVITHTANCKKGNSFIIS